VKRKKNFKIENEYSQTVLMNKEQTLKDRSKLSFAEKLEIVADLQERQYIMSEGRMNYKPWNFKEQS